MFEQLSTQLGQPIIVENRAGAGGTTAARLHLTQRALSRQIGDLEHELGFKLFDRVGRRLLLTSEGEQLLPTGKTWRARHADMSRKGFISLVTGWSGGLVLVLFISVLARYVRQERS